MTLMEMEWEIRCIVCTKTFVGIASRHKEGRILCPHCGAWSGHMKTQILICSTRTNETTDIVGFCSRCRCALYLTKEVRHIKKRYCIPCTGWLMRDQINRSKRMFGSQPANANPLTD